MVQLFGICHRLDPIGTAGVADSGAVNLAHQRDEDPASRAMVPSVLVPRAPRHHRGPRKMSPSRAVFTSGAELFRCSSIPGKLSVSDLSYEA